MADVVKKTGVARYGLYQAFKDKDQLYCCTLRRYRQKLRDFLYSSFMQSNDQPDFHTLTEHFNLILDELETGEYQGCFAHQAAIERAGKDPEVDAIVSGFFKDIEDHYRALLKRSVELKQVRDLPIEDLVAYVMGIQRALIAMSKQNCSIQERRNYVRCALELMQP